MLLCQMLREGHNAIAGRGGLRRQYYITLNTEYIRALACFSESQCTAQNMLAHIFIHRLISKQLHDLYLQYHSQIFIYLMCFAHYAWKTCLAY